MFDVSDPAKPSRLYARPLASGFSNANVEFDTHAFLWWPRTDTAVLPVGGATGSAAVGLRIRKPGGIDEIGRITHEGGAFVQRSLIVGDRLYTLSDVGVASNALSTFAPLGFLAFPAG